MPEFLFKSKCRKCEVFFLLLYAVFVFVCKLLLRSFGPGPIVNVLFTALVLPLSSLADQGLVGYALCPSDSP